MKKWISSLMAAIFVLSFSSVALASNGPEVHKTYNFKYVDIQLDELTYVDLVKYYDYIDLKDYDSYREYLEYKHSHKNNRMSYKEFLEWLELLKENNHTFGNVYLQGYQNGVAIYR